MDYRAQRQRMISEQLVPRGIKDPAVLDAFSSVERHHFVPPPFTVASYADRPLPIGNGQTISQPYMVALMTQQLNIGKDSKVLEVGTGSGYQAAILASICSKVYSVERDEDLLEKAKDVLGRGGYDNIEYLCGDGTLGWPENAPYDGIIVTAGAPGVPESLMAQMGDGGRLVVPVGSRYSQMLETISKNGGRIEKEDVCGCVFVPLIGEEGWKEGAL